MTISKLKDYITFHYSGSDCDGIIFDKTMKDKPISLSIGSNTFIPAFENKLIGLVVGETKRFKIEAKDAYGEVKKELIFDVDKKLFPDSINLTIGNTMEFPQADGKILFARIIAVKKDCITVNTNHPLAGKDLIFVVTIVDIKNSSTRKPLNK